VYIYIYIFILYKNCQKIFMLYLQLLHYFFSYFPIFSYLQKCDMCLLICYCFRCYCISKSISDFIRRTLIEGALFCVILIFLFRNLEFYFLSWSVEIYLVYIYIYLLKSVRADFHEMLNYWRRYIIWTKIILTPFAIY